MDPWQVVTQQVLMSGILAFHGPTPKGASLFSPTWHGWQSPLRKFCGLHGHGAGVLMMNPRWMNAASTLWEHFLFTSVSVFDEYKVAISISIYHFSIMFSDFCLLLEKSVSAPGSQRCSSMFLFFLVVLLLYLSYLDLQFIWNGFCLCTRLGSRCPFPNRNLNNPAPFTEKLLFFQLHCSITFLLLRSVYGGLFLDSLFVSLFSLSLLTAIFISVALFVQL